MAMLDRVIQRKILEKLAANYPDTVSGHGMNFAAEEVLRPNIAYLVEHDLVERPDDKTSSIRAMQNANVRNFSLQYKLTHKGMDFLEDDGGLSAILNIVTIKLHADTIRDLLIRKVEEADLPPEEKSTLREAIQNSPATALAAGTGDLVKMALDHLPNAIAFIRGVLGM